MFNSSYSPSAGTQSSSSLSKSIANVQITSGSVISGIVAPTQQNEADAAASEFVLPVVGLPGPMFTVIHVVALCSLSVTVLISSSLLVYLCVTSNRNRDRRFKQPCSSQSGGEQQQRSEWTSKNSNVPATAKPINSPADR
jgi:hypothetical protein